MSHNYSTKMKIYCKHCRERLLEKNAGYGWKQEVLFSTDGSNA
jgi:hypothetical protein